MEEPRALFQSENLVRDLAKEILQQKRASTEKAVVEYVMLRQNDYFSSDCFRRLKARIDRLRDSDDMKFNETNKTLSKLAFPLVKEQMHLRRAITNENYRGNPFFSLEPLTGTPKSNADNMQYLLNLNLRHTAFRSKCFRPAVNSAAKFGVAVLFCQYKNDQSMVMKTVQSQMGSERVKQPRRKKNIFHWMVHPLNYFQEASCPDADFSSIKGHIERVRLSDMQANIGNEAYIQRNLKEVLAKSRKAPDSGDDNQHFHAENEVDEHKFVLDVTKGFAKFYIKDNEESNTLYYYEIADGKLIRFQEEIYDEGLDGYVVLVYDKHRAYWWGNTDAEYSIPNENFTNLLLGVAADNAVQSQQKLRFYDPEHLSVKEINNRFKNQGWLKVDLSGTRGIGDIVQEFQGYDQSLQSTQAIMKYVNEASQRMKTKTDLNRTATEGGPQNKTLGAAQMIQAQNDRLDADLLDSFNDGIISLGRKDVILLQQFLGDLIVVQPDPKQPTKVIDKSGILGEFDYIVKTSLNKNTLMEANRIINGLNSIINIANVRPQELANLNIIEPVRDMIKNLELGDPDVILPEEAQMNETGVAALGPEQEENVSIPG